VITVYRHADSYKRYVHPLILQAGDAHAVWNLTFLKSASCVGTVAARMSIL